MLDFNVALVICHHLFLYSVVRRGIIRILTHPVWDTTSVCWDLLLFSLEYRLQARCGGNEKNNKGKRRKWSLCSIVKQPEWISKSIKRLRISKWTTYWFVTWCSQSRKPTTISTSFSILRFILAESYESCREPPPPSLVCFGHHCVLHLEFDR